MDTMETCAGCGIQSKTGHPIVAVMNKKDATDISADYEELQPNENGFVGVPCCAKCHADPDHRIRPLKAHFHPRGPAADEGVRRAGFPNIGG